MTDYRVVMGLWRPHIFTNLWLISLFSWENLHASICWWDSCDIYYCTATGRNCPCNTNIVTRFFTMPPALHSAFPFRNSLLRNNQGQRPETTLGPEPNIYLHTYIYTRGIYTWLCLTRQRAVSWFVDQWFFANLTWAEDRDKPESSTSLSAWPVTAH